MTFLFSRSNFHLFKLQSHIDKTNYLTSRYLFCVFSVWLISCNPDKSFDNLKWREKGDLGIFPYRKSMLKDLTTNYKIVGLSYNQTIDLLGVPEGFIAGHTNTLYYDIDLDYGHDIDPIYVKTLEVHFNKDSTITGFDIREWHK